MEIPDVILALIKRYKERITIAPVLHNKVYWACILFEVEPGELAPIWRFHQEFVREVYASMCCAEIKKAIIIQFPLFEV